MSEKIVWNSIKIQVPNEFITVSKNGSIKIKPPLTKTNKIATALKKPSIQLIPSNSNEVKILDQGEKQASDTKHNKIYTKKEKQIIYKENSDMNFEDYNMAKPKQIRKTIKLKKIPENSFEIARRRRLPFRENNDDININNKPTKIKLEKIPKNKFLKGSQEAKDFMAKIRASRNKKNKETWLEKNEKIVKIGDIENPDITVYKEEKVKKYNDTQNRGNMNRTFKKYVDYYFENVYKYISKQISPTNEELDIVSRIIYKSLNDPKTTHSYYANGNVKPANELF